MISIDWSKGFVLVNLKRNDNEVIITSDKLDRKGGSRFLNLKMSPTRGFWKERYSFPEKLWDTLEEFQWWLQQEFSHLEDGVYAIWAWRGSTRWNPSRTRKVRPWEPFAKFEVVDGNIIFNKDYMKATASRKTYRIWLWLEEKEFFGTGTSLPRPKKITLKDLGWE